MGKRIRKLLQLCVSSVNTSFLTLHILHSYKWNQSFTKKHLPLVQAMHSNTFPILFFKEKKNLILQVTIWVTHQWSHMDHSLENSNLYLSYQDTWAFPPEDNLILTITNMKCLQVSVRNLLRNLLVISMLLIKRREGCVYWTCLWWGDRIMRGCQCSLFLPQEE